ncbi:MAG TPA: PBP1A family penicillin-binding protein [Anaerolineae bacterium]|nr:PBP1A family penicillin-binding protein [Anaerolineae bacterium]
MPARRRARRAVAAVFLALLVAGAAAFGCLLSGLPSTDDLTGHASAPSSKIYDRSGRLLYEMPPPDTGRHSPVPLDEVPLLLRQAVIATEDAGFYENPGVEPWAIVRALWINLRGGEVLSGGSTITQQLARNLLMSADERAQRTLIRKLREAVLAWRLARHYSKDQILELYLNETYFGNMAYGVEAAAQTYFDKHVHDLDLAESAMLAGLPQAPAPYNPLEHLDAAQERQSVVLELMTRYGAITPEQARQARQEKLYYASAAFPIRAPHFVMYVRAQLEQELGLARLEQGGLRIYTTLDLDLNETARDLVRYRLERLAECNGRADCPPGGHNARNAALVALDPATGHILAMVGSPDYFSARIDGAVNGTTSLRQPGSSIKPVTYAAAFETRRLTPATMMLDLRTSFVTREGDSYVPLNYDLLFRGPVRLREALASSYNLIAVKVLETTGIETMTNLAGQLGITTLRDSGRFGLAVTLGGGEVSLLELTSAYAALDNGGRALAPVAILRVEDEKGRALLSSAHQGEGSQALDPRVAYLVTDILSDNAARTPAFGEESVLKLSRPAAVKTGTTTDFRDNWTVGYTPDLVTGVWVGNADNEPMHETSGVSGAAPIWRDFMETALRGRPERPFARPAGLVEAEVCSLSGMLAGPDCPHRVTELFLEGTVPQETCTMHRRVALDRATGLPATADTPAGRTVVRVLTLLPPEAQAWGEEQGLPLWPAGQEMVGGTGGGAEGSSGQETGREQSGDALTMSSPDSGAIYRLDPALPLSAQQIEVSAWAGGGVRLSEVRLLVDGQPLARLGTAPFSALWQLEPGLHLFSAEGVTAGGELVTSNQVRVEVRE